VETEIKLRVDDDAGIRARLGRAGFRVLRRRTFEANIVFDTPDRALRKAGHLLRLRRFGRDIILTFKGPPQPGRHKSREEIETGLTSFESACEILTRLRFEPSFRYEKYRTEFRRGRDLGLVMLDETPIGNFLELEGSKYWIDRTAALLGFHPSDYMTASYISLYLDYCRREGREASGMVFGRHLTQNHPRRRHKS